MTAVLAQDNPAETFDMQNGRYWNELGDTNQLRAVFLTGLVDGWTLRGMTKDLITAKELLVWMGGPKATMADLADMITSVYADKENAPLPVGWVAMGCLAVQRGDVTRDVMFMALRKHLTKALTRTDKHPAAEDDPLDVIMQFRKH